LQRKPQEGTIVIAITITHLLTPPSLQEKKDKWFMIIEGEIKAEQT
jgi:hypothetical protein